MITYSTTKLVESVQITLYGLTTNEDLRQQMEAYGFTKEQVQQGMDLLNDVQAVLKVRDQHNDVARELSLQINQDIDAAYSLFRRHVSTIKYIFRDKPHIVQSLNVQKVLGKKWKWIPQALYFYNKVPVYVEKLNLFEADEQWQQNQAATQALLVLRMQRLRKKADSENSTQVKDQAVEALNYWYSDFRRIARTAFHYTPKVLEAFGIIVPSSRKNRIPSSTPNATPSDDTPPTA